MITDINSEDRLVQKTFADSLHDVSVGKASMLQRLNVWPDRHPCASPANAQSSRFAISAPPATCSCRG